MEIGNKSVSQLAEELNQIPFFEGLEGPKLLRKVPFFEGVDESLIERVAKEALLLQFPPGQVICRQGDYEETFYLILSGEVEVSARDQSGREHFLAVLGRGEFFGEMGPLSGQPRTATVTAKTQTVLLQFPKPLFLYMLKKAPDIKKRIDDKYIERSLHTHLQSVSLFSSLPKHVLDELAKKVELVSFDKDEVIIKEGEEGDSLYLIRSGFVKVSKGPLEHEKILTYLKDGSYFGEMALIREEKRSANVVAITNVEAVKIKKADFQELLSRYPEVREMVEKTISAREAETEEVSHDPKLARALRFVVQKGLAQARRILVVDLEKCINCDHCTLACEAVRGVPRFERRGNRLGHLLVPASCFHCENPECLLCPFGGIVRDKNGEIHFTEFCTGCGGCARRCPYGNILVIKLDEPKKARKILAKLRPGRQYTEEDMPKQVVVKCDMCGDYSHMACAYNCPAGAMKVMTPEELIKLYDEEK